MKTINIVILVLVILAVVLGVLYVMMRSNVAAPYGTPAPSATTGSMPDMSQAPAGQPNGQAATPQTTTPQTTIPTTPQTTAPQPTVPAQPVTAAVTIQNFSFQPTPLTISAGTTVTWTNKDSVNHQIKSAAFNSSPLSGGQTFSFTFAAAGTYDYSCAIHPTMRGQIIVK